MDSKGERKPVTILFVDIVGSTAMAEVLDPEEWKEIVQGAHQRVSAAVERYGGMVAQLLGDGVLAFFGAPTTHEDDPERAARAALELQSQIKDYRQVLEGMVEDFQVRVGLHTGEVVLGEVGTTSHSEYLAVGDAVNLAARLQSAANPGQILISSEVQKKVAHRFMLEDSGMLDLKGKSDKVHAFRLVEEKQAADPARGFGGVETPFIGREVEIDRLLSAFTRLLRGQGGIMALLGEAGIGKSRMLAEAQNRLASTDRTSTDRSYSHEQIHWLEGRSLSYGGSLSNWVITQLLLNDLGLTYGAPAVRIKVALRKRIETLFGEQSEEHWPFLAHLFELDLPAEQHLLKNLDRETRRYQTKVVLQRYFSRAAESQPLVLVVEDVHWADPSSVEILTELLAVTDHSPTLLLILMREEHDHPSWELTNSARTRYPHRYEEIRLKGLPSEQSKSLLTRLIGDNRVSVKLEELIYSRAEGNPYYVEEVIRHLQENDKLMLAGGEWILKGGGQVGIPDTLQGVLLARIDRLEASVRETLQLASVIGRSFLFRILEAISEAEQELISHLSSLQRNELVVEKARLPELEYSFKHALTQEAAYSSLLLERRKAFHMRVGEAMERIFEDRREEFLGLLAYHFEQAEAADKAIVYLIRAGDRARLEDALQEAEDYFDRAIRLLDQSRDHETLARTWMKRALVYQELSQFEQAHTAYSNAFEYQELTESMDPNVARSKVRRDEPVKTMQVAWNADLTSINLSAVDTIFESALFRELYAGLVKVDMELNIVPYAAHSWEILEGGKQYIFHLRGDVLWSDGDKVTAGDFVCSMLYWISPDRESQTTLLDDVVGAEAYRKGESKDGGSVGVKALDEQTFEIRLVHPNSHFLYILAMHFGCPLPCQMLKRSRENWWKVGHILSNGPFQLIDAHEDEWVLECNPHFFKSVQGNVDFLRIRGYKDPEQIAESYLASEVDIAFSPMTLMIPASVPEEELKYPPARLWNLHFLLNPGRPPTDNLFVRRAIAYAVNRNHLKALGGIGVTTYHGGLVPPGMPGHSPGIALANDLQMAQACLQEAGFSVENDASVLEISQYHRWFDIQQVAMDLQDFLGIPVQIKKEWDLDSIYEGSPHLILMAWMADFPDPINFLLEGAGKPLYKLSGWRDPYFNSLLEEAFKEPDRKVRMERYRAADRYLVAEQALLIPLGSDFIVPTLVKPWVKNYQMNSLGHIDLSSFYLEDDHR